MPEPLDTGTFQEMPPLHGEGSQTPLDPAKGTPPPIGSGKPIKPMGSPGAPLIGGGMPGLPGALPGAKPPLGVKPPTITPEEQLNYDSMNTLHKDIMRLVKDKNIETLDGLIDKLLQEDWRVERIQDLMDFRGVDSVQNLFQDALDKIYKQDEEKTKQSPMPPVPGGAKPSLPGATPPSPSGLAGSPVQAKKPDNDLTGQNMPKPEANTNDIIRQGLKQEGVELIETSTHKSNTRGGLMKQILLKDGTLVLKEAADASEIIEGISAARRKVEALIDDYKEAYLKYAGLAALRKEGMGPMDDMIGGLMGGGPKPAGPGGLSDDLSGDLGADFGGAGLEGIVSSLKDAIQKLTDWLTKGKDKKKDESLPAADADKLEGEMNKAKGPMDKAKGLLEGPPKKEKKPEEGKNMEKEDKEEEEEENEGKEASVKSDEKGKGGDAMDVAMGKTKPKGDKGDTSKEKSEMKDGEGAKKKADLDDVVDSVIEDSDSVNIASFLDQLETKLAEMRKSANLYPFKDLNKQNVDNINEQTSKDQASTIDSEIKGGSHASKQDRGESLAPTEISETNPSVAKDSSPKPVSAPTAGKVSVEVAERIRQSSVENERAKARLSVELACQQQVKGLIDNPLKEAMVKNMVESGIGKEAAEAIAFNSFLDGYEASQKLIMKEAFDEFMNKDLDDFVKIAKATKGHRVIQGSQAVVEAAEEGTRTKSASTDSAPLRGSQSNKDRNEVYNQFWTDVARNTRRW